MRSLLALTLLLASLGSQGAEAPLNYDLQADAQQRAVIRLYIRTRVCLGTAGRAIMGQGVKEPAFVKHFMVSTCGDAFYAQLRRDGMPEESARRTLVELTEKALYEDILHQAIPNRN